MGFTAASVVGVLVFALLLMFSRCWMTESLSVFAMRVSGVSDITSRSAAAGGVCFPLQYVPQH